MKTLAQKFEALIDGTAQQFSAQPQPVMVQASMPRAQAHMPYEKPSVKRRRRNRRGQPAFQGANFRSSWF